MVLVVAMLIAGMPEISCGVQVTHRARHTFGRPPLGWLSPDQGNDGIEVLVLRLIIGTWSSLPPGRTSHDLDMPDMVTNVLGNPIV